MQGLRLYHLGCPVWSNRAWVGNFFSAKAKQADYLGQYASVFNTVEGNTTFYGLPKPETVERWRADAPAGFRFCFKFPRAISHDRRLVDAGRETLEFFTRLAPLQDRLGPSFLQLPPSFGAEDLPALNDYLATLPAGFTYAVEVRHPDFFRKGEAEKALNRLLHERGIDRVVLDSRALFRAEDGDAITRATQRQKPRVPARAVALGPQPMVRFIGHPDLDANRPFIAPWLTKLAEWIGEGRTPYLFTHMPDDRWAPWLARLFHTLLTERLPEVGVLPIWPCERDG